MISLTEARQYAIAAQGLDRAQPRRVRADDVSAVIRRLALVQLDFVNVLLPAHYLVIYSRLGAYDRKLLDDLVYRSEQFTEQWAHEASIIPVETWPLLRWRMGTFRFRPWGFEKIMKRVPEYVEQVLEEVRKRGALMASELPSPEGIAARIPGSWHRSVARATLEAHFARGVLGIADRRPGFARVYDLVERLVPAEIHACEVDADESRRRLLAQSARALGVATAADLADYFRMKMSEARPRIAELVESGELREVKVEGWRPPAFLHRDTPKPPKAAARVLLCPFDPLIWYRPRTERLFCFDYRFEIFVPESKVKWGRYVLPFLFGDKLVARVDLKAEREAKCLRVVARYYERGCKTSVIRDALDAEIRAMASWLDLRAC